MNRTFRLVLLRILAVGALGVTPPVLAAQTPLTLQRAIEIAQQDGSQGRAADRTREADRLRNRVFQSSLRPQLALVGTLPRYQSQIQPIVQPDGTTLFRTVDQTNMSLAARLTQSVPLTGGSLNIQSDINRFVRSGALDEQWNTTPFNISYTQPLLQPNTLAWQKKTEAVSADLSEKTYLASREAIAIQTTNQFFDVYIAQLSLRNAIINAERNDTLFLVNQQREVLGRIGRNELLQSEYRATVARQNVSEARITLARAEANLRMALRLPANAPLDLHVELTVPELTVDTLRAVREALQNLPAVDQVELQRLQADRAVAFAKLSNNLSGTLSASYGVNANGDGFRAAYQDPLQAKALQLSVSLPLMQFGRRQFEVRAAEADRERTQENTQTQLEQIGLDAHFAALDLMQRREALINAAKADTLARLSFEATYNRYRAGSASVTLETMYGAQTDMNSAFSGYLNALRSYWLAYYSLRQRTLFDFEQGMPLR